MRVGVIGLAGVGRIHINKWLEIAELVSVCDLDSTVLAQVAKSCQISGYTNVEQMLDKEDLQAISICTPPKSHLSITQQVADRGIHVLCEKPMASTVSDCQAMIDICSHQSVVLQIGHKKRFLPAIQWLKEISEGDFGPIQYIVHRYPHPGMSNRDWFWAEDDGGGQFWKMRFTLLTFSDSLWATLHAFTPKEGISWPTAGHKLIAPFIHFVLLAVPSVWLTQAWFRHHNLTLRTTMWQPLLE